jgi:hypothetical protein
MDNKEERDKPIDKKAVHVTVHYTMTAREKAFIAEQDNTLRLVIKEAYDKLKERPRAGDQFFCHAEPRLDLAPYLDRTLRALKEHGTCIRVEQHGDKLVFEFDIDADTGGAVA